MSTPALALLAAAGAFAVADWIAVAPPLRAKRLECVCKPATLALLVAVALVLKPDLPAQRVWFLIALVLSLAGDVFLMLPSDAFLPGLGSFFLAHIAYIGGLSLERSSLDAILICIGIMSIAAMPVGTIVVSDARRGEHPRLATPVAAYIVVISVMVACALAARDPVAFAGALFFFASDAVIGWNRFVRPIPWAQPVIMSTYHLGQALLVLSLIR